MRKLCVAVVLCIVLLTGCVSQKDYDELLHEKEALEVKIEILNEKLDDSS